MVEPLGPGTVIVNRHMPTMSSRCHRSPSSEVRRNESPAKNEPGVCQLTAFFAGRSSAQPAFANCANAVQRANTEKAAAVTLIVRLIELIRSISLLLRLSFCECRIEAALRQVTECKKDALSDSFHRVAHAWISTGRGRSSRSTRPSQRAAVDEHLVVIQTVTFPNSASHCG